VNVTISDITETRKDVVVTISADEVSSEEKRILKDFSKNARLPGFRSGKAPESLLRQKYGTAINEELRKALMRSAYEEVLGQKDLDVFNVVEFPEPEAILAGAEISLDLTVDINPAFELPEYKGLKTEIPSIEVGDEEVDAMIETIRRQRASFEEVDRAAEAGDYVKVTYTGKVGEENASDLIGDNARFRAWGAVTDGWEEAGTEEAKEFGVPEIIEAAVGMAAGDTKTVEQLVPDTFAVESLQGKTITYELQVGEVRERKLPEIDEAFLQSVRSETLEDFKAQVLDELEGRKKQEAADAQRQQILNQLHDSVDFPLPISAIEAETQQAMARIINQNMQQGVPEEEFEKHKEQIHTAATQTAQRDVKLQIMLNRIAEKESITVENEDLSRAVYSMAMQQQKKPEELAKELRNDRGKVLHLQRQILFSKTLDLLVKECESVTIAEASDPEATEK
jgi:trigger factor